MEFVENDPTNATDPSGLQPKPSDPANNPVAMEILKKRLGESNLQEAINNLISPAKQHGKGWNEIRKPLTLDEIARILSILPTQITQNVQPWGKTATDAPTGWTSATTGGVGVTVKDPKYPNLPPPPPGGWKASVTTTTTIVPQGDEWELGPGRPAVTLGKPIVSVTFSGSFPNPAPPSEKDEEVIRKLFKAANVPDAKLVSRNVVDGITIFSYSSEKKSALYQFKVKLGDGAVPVQEPTYHFPGVRFVPGAESSLLRFEWKW